MHSRRCVAGTPGVCGRLELQRERMHGVQVLNTQRDRIYSERRKALLAEDLAAVMVEYSEETMNDILEARPSRLCPPPVWHRRAGMRGPSHDAPCIHAGVD